MPKLRLVALAFTVFASGVLAGIVIHAHHWTASAAQRPGAEAAVKVAFENARVAVRTVELPPGAQRPSRTRPTDEMVVFYEEAHYQAIDAQGRTEPRDRMPGTVVWHNKGEVAPTLVNPGKKVVRYFSVSLK